jgi:hypothetical protein
VAGAFNRSLLGEDTRIGLHHRNRRIRAKTVMGGQTLPQLQSDDQSIKQDCSGGRKEESDFAGRTSLSAKVEACIVTEFACLTHTVILTVCTFAIVNHDLKPECLLLYKVAQQSGTSNRLAAYHVTEKQEHGCINLVTFLTPPAVSRPQSLGEYLKSLKLEVRMDWSMRQQLGPPWSTVLRA